MRETIELYKKEIKIFLSTLSIFKGNKAINSDKALDAEDKEFIKQKFTKIKSGNVNEEALNIAIDELLPSLYQVEEN